MNKRKCLFLYTCFLNVKIHVQVHFTIALQFYVNVNVDFFIYTITFIYMVEKNRYVKIFSDFFHCVRGFWDAFLYTTAIFEHFFFTIGKLIRYISFQSICTFVDRKYRSASGTLVLIF